MVRTDRKTRHFCLDNSKKPSKRTALRSCSRPGGIEPPSTSAPLRVGGKAFGPVSRLRLSLGTVTVVRVFQLLPITLLLLAVELARGAGPGPAAFLTAIEFFLFGDLMILLGRCLGIGCRGRR